MEPIEHSIQNQLEANRSRNLLYTHLSRIMQVEPGFLAALENLMDSSPDDFSEEAFAALVSFTAKALIGRLVAINPYLRISPDQVIGLEDIYRQTWQVMKESGDIQATLQVFHYPRLSGWIAALYPKKFRESLQFSEAVGQVTYGEYSAELQLSLLGIDPSQLKQPVLDIGCGSQANLVRHLRLLGVEACGLDRRLDVQAPYLEQADWLGYTFEPGRWGALISNMGFSNHLNYAYLHDIAQLEPYLLKMKEILASLAPGGSFYYAPGLPFIEDVLPGDRFKVRRDHKAGDVLVSCVTRIG